jgi:hypothetical protein
MPAAAPSTGTTSIGGRHQTRLALCSSQQRCGFHALFVLLILSSLHHLRKIQRSLHIGLGAGCL